MNQDESIDVYNTMVPFAKGTPSSKLFLLVLLGQFLLVDLGVHLHPRWRKLILGSLPSSPTPRAAQADPLFAGVRDGTSRCQLTGSSPGTGSQLGTVDSL